MPRCCIIGLDCLTPQLVLDRFAGILPTFDALAAGGAAAPLRSCIPPITVPAWAAMVTGVDPGSLGLYGFRGRKDTTYTGRRLASSLSYTQPPLWTVLSRAGRRCKVLGVPQTYPPKPVRGSLVSGFLTPGLDADFTYPPELATDLRRRGWRFDADDFRHSQRDALLRDIHAITAQHFALAREWLSEADWDFFMMVELGPDRMHHAFWRYMAADHPAYAPGHRFEHAIRDYYVAIDREVGRLVELLRPDDLLLIVSDHGAQTMRGGIAVNDWLIERGDLVLLPEAAAARRNSIDAGGTAYTPLEPAAVDWPRSRAWADGGYVGRIYFNVRGREPQGVVDPAAVESYADALKAALRHIPGPAGEALATTAYLPSELYREVRGIAPDLTVCFDALAYRALGSIGHGSIHVRENDTGADDANHARDGVIVLRAPRLAANLEGATIFDIAPTVLQWFGLPVGADCVGHGLLD